MTDQPNQREQRVFTAPVDCVVGGEPITHGVYSFRGWVCAEHFPGPPLTKWQKMLSFHPCDIEGCPNYSVQIEVDGVSTCDEHGYPDDTASEGSSAPLPAERE